MENKINSKKFSKYFLLIIFILSLILFLSIIKVFFIQIILAIVTAILVHPIFKIILKLIKNRGFAALICCILVLCIIIVPLSFIFNIVINQAIDLYSTVGYKINELIRIIQKDNAKVFNDIMNSFVGKYIPIQNISLDWNSILNSAKNFLSSALTNFINKSSRTTLTIIFDFSIIIFSLFYLLRDGDTFLSKLKEIIPISEEYKDRIILKFYSMTNATIRGIILIAILQSLLATLILLVFGIKAWLLWGIVSLVFSMVPFMGTGVVLVPAGIIKIITGDVGQGITIIILSFFFIAMVDNLLRPRIIGQKTGMHDLIIFFSILGGIFSFGPAGFIIGPLISSIFLTILQIYKLEFQQYYTILKK